MRKFFALVVSLAVKYGKYLKVRRTVFHVYVLPGIPATKSESKIADTCIAQVLADYSL